MKIFNFGKKNNDVSIPKFKVDFVMSTLSEKVDWGLMSFGVPDWWRETKGDGIKVAVLDTGADLNHMDLKPNIAASADFTRSKKGAQDVVGHGTHVAGIIAAIDNGVGVIGVAPHAKLYIGKVLDDAGNGDYGWIVEGINWALQQNVDIISMSLGGPVPSERLDQNLKKAVVAGKIIVCAAGNDGDYSDDTINYPAKYSEVISVGSIDRNMQRSAFSSVGKRIDIMAPGGTIYSCYPPNRYAILSGTSMATPFISGVCALVLSKHRKNANSATPIKSCEDMRQHLIKSATKMVDIKKYGYGIVNPRTLIKET